MGVFRRSLASRALFEAGGTGRISIGFSAEGCSLSTFDAKTRFGSRGTAVVVSIIHEGGGYAMPVFILNALLCAHAVSPTLSARPSVLRERVDLIELNHFVDEEGREVFRQVIFYDWSDTHRRFHVRAWRLVKSPRQIPKQRWNPRRFECTWHDDGLLRQVWAPSMRETWTQNDPERVNRRLLPEDRRVPLWMPKRPSLEDQTASR